LVQYRHPREIPAAAVSGHGFSVIPLAEESLEIDKRTVDRGKTQVRRHVVEQPVERDVTLHGQRVTIERRRPVDTSVPGYACEERTVGVRETEEVPMVEKTARVVEEVAIRKEERRTPAEPDFSFVS
jgi:stress response protein YsnF